MVRISGPDAAMLLEKHGVADLSPRIAKLVAITHSQTRETLDKGLALWFPGPASFTGEDCVELHVHGGPAVVQAILTSLLCIDNVRLAEAGEFSRRAFENGKFDLTEIEGLSDLLASQTEAQRKQALDQGEGSLRKLYEGWRKRLISIQAMLAAEIDFVDEDDIPEDAGELGLEDLQEVFCEIRTHLNDHRAGEIIRDGFRVVIMGPPNAGKSTLLNTLARRDVAIVTSQAGTTRDVLDVHLDIDGYAVIVSDTAGIRDTDDIVEQEGIRRARARSSDADLSIWLQDVSDNPNDDMPVDSENMLVVRTKDDNGSFVLGTSISCETGHGIDWFMDELKRQIMARVSKHEPGLISRSRHRVLLQECSDLLEEALQHSGHDVDLKAEAVRGAGNSLGKIVGQIDVEDLLDVIFSEFCVGK